MNKLLIAIFLLLNSLFWVASAASKTLYVATNGSDSVTYADNSISNPWKTINVGVYQLKAGDTLLIRGGVYKPSHIMYTKNDYTSKVNGNPYNMNAESGSAGNRVTISGYPGEAVNIDLADTGQFISLDAKNYWTIESLNFVNGLTAIHVGYDVLSQFNEFRSLRIIASKGGDNQAGIKLDHAENTIVEFCTLIGPGTGSSIHLNTSSLYVTRNNRLIVRNNLFANAPLGFYFKHANDGNASSVDIQIENNIFLNHSRRSIETNANYAVFKNNLFGAGNAGVRNNEANGVPGGDFNSFIDNTFFDSTVTFSADTQAGDVNPGSVGNIFSGNIFKGTMYLHPYSDVSMSLSGENNLIASSSVLNVNRNAVTATQFLAANPQLSNTVVAEPKFTSSDGNKTFSFLLKSDSPGKGAGANKDAGVDVTLLGPDKGRKPEY